MATPSRKNLPEVTKKPKTVTVRAVVGAKEKNILVDTKATPKADKKVPKVSKVNGNKSAKAPLTTKEKVVKKTSSVTKKAQPKVSLKPEDIVSETVFVPSTASLRLLEKLEIYKTWYESEFPNRVSRFARVSGYTFLLLGTVFASYAQIMSKNFDNTAALVCSEMQNCVEVDSDDLPNNAPQITFLNTVPAVLTTEVDLVVRNERVGEAVVYLEGIESGKKYTLSPVELVKDNERKYLIAVQNLESGSYIVKARSDVSGTSYIFSGSQFSIPSNGEPETVTTSRVLPVSNSDLSTTTATSTSEESVVIEDEIIEKIENSEFESTINEGPLSINIESLSESVFLRIKDGEYVPQNVYVYSRPTFAKDPIFLGQATMVQGDWIFNLNALDLPRFEHQLYAQFETQGRIYKTPAVSYTPIPPVTPSFLNGEELSLVVEKIDLALTTAELNVGNRNKYFTYIASTTDNFFASNNESSFASGKEIEQANAVMEDLSKEIDDLLLRYAAALQGGKKYLLTVASLSQRDMYQEYLSLNNQKNPIIETLLSQRFHSLRDRVKEEEERIMAETNDLTIRDSDKDGIGDFDEMTTFGSDPNKTDTDRDGVLDGIEVVTGSNPASPDILAIAGENKTSAEIINSEVIEIKSIEGIKSVEQSQGLVYPLVRGKTVPHATVWLDFPTVGTRGLIKANAEGVFAYTLEQAIKDGEHTVTASIIDSYGNLAAVTEPTSFKVADSNLVAALLVGETSVINEVENNNDFRPVTTAGVALVAFGFLLLILSALAKPKQKGAFKNAF